MNKLSNAQISEVLGEVPGVIRGLVERNQFLEEKVASMERRDRVEKLAHEMHRKGINVDTPIDALADSLEKAAAAGKSIELIEQAVDYVAPDMGTKIAHLANDEQRSGLGSSDFERYLIGSIG